MERRKTVLIIEGVEAAVVSRHLGSIGANVLLVAELEGDRTARQIANLVDPSEGPGIRGKGARRPA